MWNFVPNKVGFEFIVLEIKFTLVSTEDQEGSGLAVLIEKVPDHSYQPLPSLLTCS